MNKVYSSILLICTVVGFWMLYIILHFVDLLMIFTYVMFIYETVIAFFIILLTYIFGIIKASIPYIIIYFGLCLLNIQYEGYVKWKFFGILLNTFENSVKLNKVVWYLKEYSYFFLILFHFWFLLFIIYYELLNNIFFIMFIITFYFLIWLNIQIKHFVDKDLNWKDRYVHLFLNISLVTIFFFYINVLFDFLTPYIGFKINFYDSITRLTEERLILKLSQDNKNWFSLYVLNKEYWSKKTVWTLKNKFIDSKYFYKYKNIYTKSKIYNKPYNRYFINMLNLKNEQLYEQQMYEKTSLKNLNFSNNYIYLNNITPSDIFINSINKNILLNTADVNHDIDNYLNWKLTFLDRTGLNVEQFYPTEELPHDLPYLIKESELDVSNLLLNKNDLKKYNEYLSLWKKISNKKTFTFDILLKQKITVYDLLRFNYFNENFKALLQLNNIYKPAAASIEVYNKHNFYYLYELQKFNNNNILKFYYQVNNIIDDLYKFKELLNTFNYFSEDIKVDSDTSLFKYNNFLLWWENNKYIKVMFSLVQESYENYNYDVTKVIENLVDNDPYVEFEGEEGEKEEVSIDLTEFSDAKELYLSWYTKEALLFYQIFYPLKSKIFYNPLIKDIFFIENATSSLNETNNIENIEDVKTQEQLDNANSKIFQQNSKASFNFRSSYMQFNQTATDKLKYEAPFSKIIFLMDSNENIEESGSSKIFKLNKAKFEEISVEAYNKAIKEINKYDDYIYFKGYDFNYEFLNVINFKHYYFQLMLDNTIENKLDSDLDDFLDFIEVEKEEAIELVKYQHFQKLLYYYITKPHIAEFLKTNENMETFYINLLRYNLLTFKDWVNLLNKEFTLTGPHMEHQFLNKTYFLKALQYQIDYYNSALSKDATTIYGQMEKIKRISNFYDFIDFTSKDMRFTDTNKVMDLMIDNLVEKKTNAFMAELSRKTNELLENLEDQYTMVLDELAYDHKILIADLEVNYVKNYKILRNTLKAQLRIDEFAEQGDFKTVNDLLVFDYDLEVEILNEMHLDLCNELVLIGKEEEILLYEQHAIDIEVLSDELVELYKGYMNQADIEIENEVLKFHEWVNQRRSLPHIPKKKIYTNLTNYYKETNWDSYNKSRAKDEIFKSNLFKKKK